MRGKLRFFRLISDEAAKKKNSHSFSDLPNTKRVFRCRIFIFNNFLRGRANRSRAELVFIELRKNTETFTDLKNGTRALQSCGASEGFFD